VHFGLQRRLNEKSIADHGTGSLIRFLVPPTRHARMFATGLDRNVLPRYSSGRAGDPALEPDRRFLCEPVARRRDEDRQDRRRSRAVFLFRKLEHRAWWGSIRQRETDPAAG
jgi:hypothetical protein